MECLTFRKLVADLLPSTVEIVSERSGSQRAILSPTFSMVLRLLAIYAKQFNQSKCKEGSCARPTFVPGASFRLLASR